MSAMTDTELTEFWSDFDQRMSPYQADKRMGIAKDSVMAAIRRKEIEPLRVPKSKRVYVTPRLLAEWVLEYWH